MEIKEITFTETYKEFTVGEVVSPCSGKCSLPNGKYVVTAFHAPHYPGDQAIVFLEGQKYGVSTEFLEPAFSLKDLINQGGTIQPQSRKPTLLSDKSGTASGLAHHESPQASPDTD